MLKTIYAIKILIRNVALICNNFISIRIYLSFLKPEIHHFQTCALNVVLVKNRCYSL